MYKKYIKKSFKKYARKPFKKYTRRPNTYKLTKLLKNISLKNAETKYKIQTVENAQLYHNAGTTSTGNYVLLSNLLQTNQGQTQNTRLGDEVVGRGLSIKLWLSAKNDRPNVLFRVILFTTPPDQASSAAPTSLFMGENGNKIIDNITTDRYNVIFNKVIKIKTGDFSLETGATLRESSMFFKKYINLKNRKIVYQVDNGAVPKYSNNCMSIAVIPYDAFGTLTTDNIASCACITKFYFKDP